MSDIPGVPLGMRIKSLTPIKGGSHYLCALEPDTEYRRPLDEVPIPEGERRAETDWFRPWRKGDRFISIAGHALDAHDDAPVSGDQRRIILQPKPAKRVFLFTEGEGTSIFHPEGSCRNGMFGTARELPTEGPEYEALIERLAQATRRLYAYDKDIIRAVLDELLNGEPGK